LEQDSFYKFTWLLPAPNRELFSFAKSLLSSARPGGAEVGPGVPRRAQRLAVVVPAGPRRQAGFGVRRRRCLTVLSAPGWIACQTKHLLPLLVKTKASCSGQ